MWKLAALAAAGALAWFGLRQGKTTPQGRSVMTIDPTAPRGIRNNNPGNLRRGATPWEGLDPNQSDPVFFQFLTPFYGLRALAMTLHTYRDQHGLYTVRGIINRWAPSSENNTSAYLQDVANQMGVSPDEPLNWTRQQLRHLVAAIVDHENGLQPYSNAQLDNAITAAGW